MCRQSTISDVAHYFLAGYHAFVACDDSNLTKTLVETLTREAGDRPIEVMDGLAYEDLSNFANDVAILWQLTRSNLQPIHGDDRPFYCSHRKFFLRAVRGVEPQSPNAGGGRSGYVQGIRYLSRPVCKDFSGRYRPGNSQTTFCPKNGPEMSQEFARRPLVLAAAHLG